MFARPHRSAFQPRGRRGSRVAVVAATGLLATGLGVPTAFAAASTDVNVTVSCCLAVGDTVQITVGIGNFNTAPQSSQTICNFGDAAPCSGTEGIEFTGSCGGQPVSGACLPADADPDLYAITGAVGVGGTACSGIVFGVVSDDAATGRYRFVPPAGQHITLPTPGSVCAITVTVKVRRVPTKDAHPGLAGMQTNTLAAASATSPGMPATSSGDVATALASVLPGIAAMTTFPTASVVLGSGVPIGDSATVTGPAGAVVPTGTVQFDLYRASDCSGGAVFSTTNGLTAGASDASATASPFPPLEAGTYTWKTTYNGDGNYLPTGPVCGGASIVNPANSAMATSATPSVTLGGQATGTATIDKVGTLAAPTGQVTFAAFDNTGCTGTPVFGPVGATLVAGATKSTATSPAFTATHAGTYTWQFDYPGDTGYAANGPVCGASTVVTAVGPATPTITTSATPTVTLGGTATDTATVSGPAGADRPTGTVTFAAYDNSSCAGTPVFGPAAATLTAGATSSTATSGIFTPAAAGTYTWKTAYSGDGNYTAPAAACGGGSEVTIVGAATPTITTDATPTLVLGGTATDTATVTGPAGAPVPTGSVTFAAYDNSTCAGTPAFGPATATLTTGAAGSTATSPIFTPAAAGTYTWKTTYSGEPNYVDPPGACGGPGETTTVTAVPQPPQALKCNGIVATKVGTENGETITGTSGRDVIVALGGNDIIDGRGGNDVICAGSGNDTVTGGDGKDQLYGGEGDDYLRGNDGKDRLRGENGNDRLLGDDGNDDIKGGDGDDLIKGGEDKDALDGDAGNDTIKGDSGKDDLDGGSGDDHLDGGSGRDHGHGGSGHDKVTGCERED